MIISIALISKNGIVGVAIGTLCSVIYRGITFVKYISKKILERKIWISIKKIILCVLQYLSIYFICKYIKIEISSYIDWIIYAIVVLGISTTIVGITTVIFDKKIITNVKDLLKRSKK